MRSANGKSEAVTAEGEVQTDAARPRNRRGRPSREEAAAIDARVLEAARHCFLESGFTGTTMDGIAEAAGVTKVTLYQRYADKVALLRAVMQERIAIWSAASDLMAPPRGDTLDARLRQYGRSMLRWAGDAEVKAFGDLIRECWGSARAVAEEMQAIRFDRILALLERDIAAFSAREGVGVAAPRQVAELFLGMLMTFARPAEPEVEAAIAAHVDFAVDVLMQGRGAWQDSNAAR